MKFVMSYSCGKDSTLSLQKLMDEGHEPVALLTMIKEDLNRAWDEERCKNTGLPGAFPLWQRKRTDIVEEIIQSGYTCLIKTVNNKLLPKSLLGQELGPDTLDVMKVNGIDVCGENGEYHTIVVDGPIFKTPVPYTLGKVLDFGDWSAMEVE